MKIRHGTTVCIDPESLIDFIHNCGLCFVYHITIGNQHGPPYPMNSMTHPTRACTWAMRAPQLHPCPSLLPPQPPPPVHLGLRTTGDGGGALARCNPGEVGGGAKGVAGEPGEGARGLRCTGGGGERRCKEGRTGEEHHGLHVGRVDKASPCTV